MYRVFQRVLRSDPLQLLQSADAGIFPLVLPIAYQQVVILAVGCRVGKRMEGEQR